MVTGNSKQDTTVRMTLQYNVVQILILKVFAPFLISSIIAYLSHWIISDL